MPLKVESVKERYAEFKKLAVLICGDPGTGKTLFSTTWPDVVILDAEGRLLSVRDRDIRAITVGSTSVLDEARAALAQAPDVRAKLFGGPVSTVVIDTVDEVARLIIRERLRAEKRETMAMADWGYLGDTLRSLLRGFRNLDLNVIFNVHLRSSEDSESGRIFYRPSIQGQVGDEIAAYVDLALLLVTRPVTDPVTGNRVISRHLQSFPDVQHTWIKDHSGRLPQEFPVNFTDDYDRLHHLIFSSSTPVPPSSPSQASTAPPPVQHTTNADVPAAAQPKRGPGRPRKTPAPVSAPAPAPAPAAGTLPAPAASAAEATAGPAAEPEPAPTETVDSVPCEDCGKPLHLADPDEAGMIELSKARWKVPLCRGCYGERKKTKTAARS
jgi:hypothetical protein